MEQLRYISLAAAVLVGIVLIIRPKLGLLGLVLLIPFLTRFIPRAQHGLNAETPLFLLAILMMFFRARPALPPMRILIPYAAYYGCVAFAFAMLAARYDADRTGIPLFYWAETMKSDLWPTLLFFVAYAFASDRVMRERIFTCMIAVVFVYAVSGLIDFYTGPRWTPGGWTQRAAGVLAANPNLLGGHLAAFSVIPLMAMVRRENSPSVRAACGMTYAIAVVVLVLSQSRGSWLGFLGAHAVWLAYRNRKLLLPAALAFCLIASIGYSWSLLPTAITERIEQTLTPGHKIYQTGPLSTNLDSSVLIRIALYRMGGEMFLDSPIWGHGLRGFRFLTNEYGPKYGVWSVSDVGVDSESLILTVAVDNGLIGLAVLAWLTWALVSRAFALARRGSNERAVGIAFLSISAAVGLESLTQNALNSHEIAMPFWLCAGMAMRACGEQELARTEKPQSIPGRLSIEARVEPVA